MSRTRIAVIGAGNWGRNHLRTVAAMPEADLAAVCEEDAGRRDALADQYPGVPIVDSLGDAFDLADGVIIATPAVTHAAIGLQAIERGLPALIEKPMSLSVEDAVAVETAARERDVPVLAGHLLLFHPAVEYLQQLVSSQELGQIYYLYTQRCGNRAVTTV